MKSGVEFCLISTTILEQFTCCLLRKRKFPDEKVTLWLFFVLFDLENEDHFFLLCYFPWASRPSTLRKNQNNCPRSYKKGENEESLKCSELEGVQNKTYRARNKGQSAVNDHQILRLDCQKYLICDQGDQPLFCNKSCTQVNSDRWWTVYKML